MNKVESYGEIKEDGKLHIIKRDAFLEAIKVLILKKDIYNEETGDKWQTISSTTELTTIAFNEYIEDWRIFAIEYLNTTIPEPNEETQELKL